ncbi:MAG: polyphosphate polymerase domain-containing protein [Gemmobacter sp.]
MIATSLPAPAVPSRLDAFGQGFAPVALHELEAHAAMLERLDNKYVVPFAVLDRLADRLAETFHVLEIDGTRSFRYATTYFDTPDRRAYFDHLQGRRRRCKVRVRRYLDANQSFVEIKLKDRRDTTVKRRFCTDPRTYPLLDPSRFARIAEAYRLQYGEPFEDPLAPTLEVFYRRLTLVARDGGERMTVDSQLSFVASDARRGVRSDLVIVETKSRNGRGLADRLLRAAHVHPVGACSKYCLGMAALGQVGRANRFLPALRRLGLR